MVDKNLTEEKLMNIIKAQIKAKMSIIAESSNLQERMDAMALIRKAIENLSKFMKDDDAKRVMSMVPNQLEKAVKIDDALLRLSRALAAYFVMEDSFEIEKGNKKLESMYF